MYDWKLLSGGQSGSITYIFHQVFTNAAARYKSPLVSLCTENVWRLWGCL